MAGLIVVLVFAVVVLFVLARTIRIVPQARAGIVSGSAATTARSTPGSRSSCRSSTG
jgi:uncharacterized membrane protein YqiK